jgi:Ca2+-binding EF-hand superfamily protein
MQGPDPAEAREAFAWFDRGRSSRLTAPELLAAVASLGYAPTAAERAACTQTVAAIYGGALPYGAYLKVLSMLAPRLPLAPERASAAQRDLATLVRALGWDDPASVDAGALRRLLTRHGDRLSHAEVDAMLAAAAEAGAVRGGAALGAGGPGGAGYAVDLPAALAAAASWDKALAGREGGGRR